MFVQQNNREQNNVNTRGIQFMNKDGFDPSTMIFGYWNELVSIKIHPALEKSKQTESKVFDYEKVVSTALTLEKVTLLLKGIEKKILPAIEKGENETIGVPVGSDSLFVVSTGKKTTGSIRPYIAIYKSLDEKTKKPEMSIAYEFNKSYTVDDYDPDTGEYSTTKDINAEFDLFIELLKASRTALSNAFAHASRNVDRFYKDKVYNTLEEIASKLGVSSSGSGKGSYGKRRDIFADDGDVNSSNNSSGATMNVESLSNIDEIDNFLN